MSQTSPSYSPRPTGYRPHCVLLALIVATSNSLSSSPPAPSLTSYLSLCILQLPGVCHSESCANQVTKLAIILATSYSLSSSPRLTPSHSCHVLLAIVLATSTLIDIILVTVYSTTSRCLCHSESCTYLVTKLAIILAVSYSLSSSPPAPSLTSYLSLCILQLPGVFVTLRAALTMSQSSPSYSPRPTRYRPHRVLLPLIVATSYLLSSSPLASLTPSSS